MPLPSNRKIFRPYLEAKEEEGGREVLGEEGDRCSRSHGSNNHNNNNNNNNNHSNNHSNNNNNLSNSNNNSNSRRQVGGQGARIGRMLGARNKKGQRGESSRVRVRIRVRVRVRVRARREREGMMDAPGPWMAIVHNPS